MKDKEKKYTKSLKELKEKYPNLATFGTIEESLSMLAEEYTLSFSDVCKTLMCSRSWVSKFVKPQIEYMYVPYASPLRFPQFNDGKWAPQKDCIYFSRRQFKELFFSGVKNVTRSSIAVSKCYLIDKNQALEVSEYIKNARKAIKKIKKQQEKNWKKAVESKNERLIKKEIENQEDTKWRIFNIEEDIIETVEECMCIDRKEDVVSATSRGECPLTPVELPDYFCIEGIKAVHDLKDYGDTDEMIYRELFSESHYRFELVLPDINGVPSKKVYYFPADKEKIKLKNYLSDDVICDPSVLSSVLISYEKYLELCKLC